MTVTAKLIGKKTHGLMHPKNTLNFMTFTTQRTLPYSKCYDDSKNSELLRRSVFTTPPQIYYAMGPSLRGKRSVIPRKMVSAHKVHRDSKSRRRTQNTTSSKFTTSSIFSTVGSFGYVFLVLSFVGIIQRKIKGQQLKGKIVSEIFPQDFPLQNKGF